MRTGVHRNYIGGIERAEREPSAFVVHRLAVGLDLAVSEIVIDAEAILTTMSAPGSGSAR